MYAGKGKKGAAMGTVEPEPEKEAAAADAVAPNGEEGVPPVQFHRAADPPAAVESESAAAKIGGESNILVAVRCRPMNDREQSCLALEEKYGGVIVLKGAGTLIAARQHERVQLAVCTHGNPGMGSGGMGDALSGVIGGLAAQGFPLQESAELGVCIHGLAADLIARDTGERGMLASDLFPYIHRLVNQL